MSDMLLMQLVQGRPADITGRLPVEMAVYDLLDLLGIAYERVDHEAVYTMEACAGVEAILQPAVICKNLFLCNRQKTQFYLLMIPGNKKFKTKDLSRQLGAARLSFAPEEFMMEYLCIAPGSVSVMGLMNDAENHVRLLIDKDVLKEEFLGCHPCVNTSSLRIRMCDLTGKFLPAVHHEYTKVDLPDA